MEKGPGAVKHKTQAYKQSESSKDIEIYDYKAQISKINEGEKETLGKHMPNYEKWQQSMKVRHFGEHKGSQ